jgi:serine/threonine protein kinase
MNAPTGPPPLTPSDLAAVDAVAEQFDRDWNARQPPRPADYLGRLPESLRPSLAVELACIDLEQRIRRGLPVDLDAYLAELPELAAAGPGARADLEAHQQRQLALQTTRLADPPPAAEAALPSHIGRYPVHRRIDGGGQATAYLGLHPTLGRPVVLKWLNADLKPDPAHGERLAREGRLLAELNHPHIVRVHDLDVHQGRPFLVMEHVEGRTLLRYAQEEHPDPARAAEIVARLARALASAHARGITHQDVNPRNVLIDTHGAPRLIDFGLAWYRPAWADGEDPLNTASGTPRYLAPEQAGGQAEAIGPATDVFGLGAVLYFLLTGRPLYDGQTLPDVLKQAEEAAIDLKALERPEVPRRLRQACRQALAAKAADRPTARQLADALAPGHTRKWLTAGLAVLVLVVGLAAGWWLQRVLFPPSPEGPDLPRLDVWVWRPATRWQPLRKAVPLKSGDEIQLRCRVPAGMSVSLFLVNGRGQLRRVRDFPAERAAYQASHPSETATVRLTGPAGTELFFVCGRYDAAVTEEEVRARWRAEAGWQGLKPAGRLLHLGPNGVVDEGERPRDLADEAIERGEPDAVRRLLERFRERLRDDGLLFDGLAFRHD